MKKNRKPKSYGKTAKQWDTLYNRYKEGLRYQHGITRLTKTEFKEAWSKRGKKETIATLVEKTKTESLYSQYLRVREKNIKKGYASKKELSEKAFYSQIGEYNNNVKSFVEYESLITRKQAKNWSEHAAFLGMDVSIDDFRAMNDKYDAFWALVNSLGGWEVAFESYEYH